MAAWHPMAEFSASMHEMANIDWFPLGYIGFLVLVGFAAVKIAARHDRS